MGQHIPTRLTDLYLLIAHHDEINVYRSAFIRKTGCWEENVQKCMGNIEKIKAQNVKTSEFIRSGAEEEYQLDKEFAEEGPVLDADVRKLKRELKVLREQQAAEYQVFS